MKQILSLTLLGSLPGLALAHGEHGVSLMDGLLHMVSDGVHLWPLALLMLLVVSLKRPLRRLWVKRSGRRD